ncbi:hypothetical protein GR925_36200 [Streptomyces sp. HUCO-GS316]|uniref:hypothetical protein n=1 Tax=Streptomyces sp. HUCO-GS316 TaxID=2692198 RepID=UPI001367C9F9|nr:hypothetical protein [Streptomyces sp. HUCO-GS316]
MHAYDVSRRQSLQIPSARPAQDHQGGPSATPIYDALYAEYVESFRALPGDRSGEEELGFTGFGNLSHAHGGHRPGSFSSSYGAYSTGALSTRHSSGQWQRVGQIAQQHGTGMHHVPAALPPGPRRGL